MPLLCSATSAYHQPGQAAKQQQSTSVREFQSSCESLQVPASSSVPCEFLRVPASPCESLRVPASSCEFQCSNKRRRESRRQWPPSSNHKYTSHILTPWVNFFWHFEHVGYSNNISLEHVTTYYLSMQQHIISEWLSVTSQSNQSYNITIKQAFTSCNHLRYITVSLQTKVSHAFSSKSFLQLTIELHKMQGRDCFERWWVKASGKAQLGTKAKFSFSFVSVKSAHNIFSPVFVSVFRLQTKSLSYSQFSV